MLNTRTCFYLVIAHIVLTVGCASQIQLPRQVRVAIEDQYQDQTVELRQSVYFGDLYDENEQWLVSPYPFASTFHIVDFDGNPIHPKNQVGIIPAGTTFIIEKIEFPNALAIAKRMITSPRFNTWVYLRPDPESDLAIHQAQDKPFILPLPLNLSTEEKVHQAIRESLTKRGEVTEWLAKRRPTVQAAIAHKTIISGMTQEELVAAVGKPHRWISEFNNNKKTLVAWYPDQEAWLNNKEVVVIRPSRVLPISAQDPQLQN